jgi:C4-dicarboxylate transporter DctQ subunit
MLKKVFDIVERVFCFLMSVFMVVMVIAVFYQVVLRYVFNSPNIWAEELARYCLIYISLFASAVAIRRYSHIRIDFFVHSFPKKAQKFLDLFAYILMLIFLIFLFYYGVRITAQTGNQITGGLKLPISYIYASIPIGVFFMIVFIIENLYRKFIKPAFSSKGESVK